jgi:uncharacterized protein YjbI with pentapeptide repeats
MGPSQKKKDQEIRQGKNPQMFHLERRDKRGQISLIVDPKNKRKLVEDLIKEFDKPNGPKPDAYDFSKLDVQGVDLRGIDLRKLGATALRQINFTGADLSFQNLSGLDLHGAHFDKTTMFRTRFEGANLREAHMRQADVSGSNFIGVDAPGIDLTDATARDISWEGRFNGGKFLGCDMAFGRFSEGSQFGDSNLTNSNQTTSRLTGHYTNLTYASLDESLNEASRYLRSKAEGGLGRYQVLRDLENHAMTATPTGTDNKLKIDPASPSHLKPAVHSFKAHTSSFG